jgi:hypothetical protein
MVCDISERFKMKWRSVFSLGRARSAPANSTETQAGKGFDPIDAGPLQHQNTLAAL